MKKTKFNILKASKFVQYNPLPIKVGMDSDTIVHILNNPYLFTSILIEISDRKIELHIHTRSSKEVPNVLTRDYNWNYNEANQKLQNFLKNYNVKIVPVFKGNPWVKILEEKCYEKKIPIHKPDSFIIADFKTFGIARAYSGNDHFLEACKILDIRAIKTETPDRAIGNKLREFFSRRTKFHRK